jgi:hypothetical protein
MNSFVLNSWFYICIIYNYVYLYMHFLKNAPASLSAGSMRRRWLTDHTRVWYYARGRRKGETEMVETECRDLREGFSCSSVGTMQKRDRDETTPYQPESPFADRDDSSRGLCYSGGGGAAGRPAGAKRTETCARSSVGVAARSVGHRFAAYLPAISRNIFSGRLPSPFSESLMDACTFQRWVRNHMVDVSKN